MNLTEAIGLRPREVVALVGGGGKTATMYGLCREAAALRRHAIASGTARFTPPADRLDAPLIIEEDEERLVDAVRAKLIDEPWVIAATGHGSKGRLLPITTRCVSEIEAMREVDLLALEADGSAMRPFKAPGEHEPVVPSAATTVVAVVGADVFGRALDEDAVHRHEEVMRLTGSRRGDEVTPAMVASVLSHPEGGRKAVPPVARFVVVINKVTEARRVVAEETAKFLLDSGVERVVLAQAREPVPVVAVFRAS